MKKDINIIPGRPLTDSILGIDIGSVSLSLVQMNLAGKILKTCYVFHRGQIRESLLQAGKNIDLAGIRGIACTSLSALNPETVHLYNPHVAAITAARKLSPSARSVLLVGAEKFMLFRFDSQGHYESTKSNSSCAAGTGSFLDQQASRLNLSGVEELSLLASRNKRQIPDIASRCAVFAKTDIIHAQQKGYSPEAICDSLCKGLARNIIDTLFNRNDLSAPILIAGGVSKNEAVIRHLEEGLEIRFLRHEYSHLFGALGACYLLLNETAVFSPVSVNSLGEIMQQDNTPKEYFHEPLSLDLTGYPDFTYENTWHFTPFFSSHTTDVQVEMYLPVEKGETCSGFLGIDIGSTSTKAIMINDQASPVAGFYTYTAGRPLNAVQSIFEAVNDLALKRNIFFSFRGVGTTGSGRKFIGKILRADLVLDEITAHARAAFELDPRTDTIIEIGGQDAKFTLMQDGMVTFSQMNTVCAAGTGSFLEEQGKKLEIELSEFSQRAEGVRAPLASDRCTVFMERDVNHLLNQGYSVNEVLSTTLHSVMENFLKKVAGEATIGNHVCFQGATARNKSLVAAFEQKLGKKIFVSSYCHLTGALGTALWMMDEKITKTRFRGLQLYKENIPIDNETCHLCSNHCLISLATVQGEEEAYGFLCGRDYDTQKYVNNNTSGFNLLETQNILFPQIRENRFKKDITIGIPASLHLFEELSLWKQFFRNLSIRAVTSEHYMEPVKTGKRIAGAEFCTPIDSMYGHVAYLADKVDYIFLPVILEAREKPNNSERHFCYYTQFSPSLVYTLKDQGIHEKCLSPLLTFSRGNKFIIDQLFKCLKPVLGNDLTYSGISRAYEEALLFFRDRSEKLYDIFSREVSQAQDISVVLMGRPYIVLSNSMNKRIPDIFSGMGIKTFFQDMVPPDDLFREGTENLLKEIPWHYAARILKTAQTIATNRNLYPVLITAFKCAPDSFIIEYFKKLFKKYRKPYLILQIDEHDSNMGYETRIEAAIRSFRNHASITGTISKIKGFQVLPPLETRINGKTLLFPTWDPIVSRFLVANLKRAGIDARSLESSEMIIRKSMAHNTGQCLPLNIITQEFIEYVEKYGLKPENTMLWMTKSRISCNLRLYPYFIKTLLEAYGKGFEKAHVYLGDLTHLEISLGTCYYAYFAYLLGGLIRKLGCKIRPYELVKGETDQAIEKSICILEQAFTGNRQMDNAVNEALSCFEKIPKHNGHKPGVAIFGDLYVRDNNIMNQDLIHAIEGAGGEVITTPYTDIVKMTIENVLRRTFAREEYLETGLYRVMLTSVKLLEDKYYKQFKKYLGDKPVIRPKKLEKNLAKFNINPFHCGESYENILKIFHILENYPDISLFIQTNPAFCCPSLVTEAMTQEIKRITGIPIVTITYDGTSDYKNDVIIPYLKLFTN